MKWLAVAGVVALVGCGDVPSIVGLPSVVRCGWSELSLEWAEAPPEGRYCLRLRLPEGDGAVSDRSLDPCDAKAHASDLRCVVGAPEDLRGYGPHGNNHTRGTWRISELSEDGQCPLVCE